VCRVCLRRFLSYLCSALTLRMLSAYEVVSACVLQLTLWCAWLAVDPVACAHPFRVSARTLTLRYAYSIGNMY
jgi:hypothetical protein